MRFRLVYDEELWAQRDPIGKLAAHKQAIRKVFHRQLKQLWETDWFLSTHSVNPQNYGANRVAAETGAMWDTPASRKTPLVEAVAHSHQEHGDPPGSAIHAGDLDNRIKTLIDGLRKPNSAAELAGTTPAEGEDPFFCLLEDDNLVTGLTIETDRLLEPPAGTSDQDRRQVRLIITVDVRPYDVTSFNLSFA